MGLVVAFARDASVSAGFAILGGFFAACLRLWNYPQLGLSVFVLWSGAAAVWVSLSLQSPRACFIFILCSVVSCSWWLHGGWVPLVFVVCMGGSVLGLTSRNLPQNQGLTHAGWAILSVVTGGILDT